MKKECSDIDRAIRLTRIKVWLQKRFWKWINSEPQIISYQWSVAEKAQKYGNAIRRIEKELNGIIWLEGYKRK